MNIRPADAYDLSAILAIYNHEILTSTAVYTDDPYTLDQRIAWFAEKKESGMPVFVVEDGDGVAGFGTYGPFRSSTGYRFCVEHSVYIATAKRRHGYGRAMLMTLIDSASAQGMHTMIAGINRQNEGSIKLHRTFGFTECACVREAGFKFNRWLDLVLMQKILKGD